MGPVELLFVITVLAVLVVGLRVVFGGSERPRGMRRRDYGLLREVAVTPSPRAATTVTDLLRAHGIRCTTAPRTDADGLRVLVFPADEHRAVRLLLDEPWSSAD